MQSQRRKHVSLRRFYSETRARPRAGGRKRFGICRASARSARKKRGAISPVGSHGQFYSAPYPVRRDQNRFDVWSLRYEGFYCKTRFPYSQMRMKRVFSHNEVEPTRSPRGSWNLSLGDYVSTPAIGCGTSTLLSILGLLEFADERQL